MSYLSIVMCLSLVLVTTVDIKYLIAQLARQQCNLIVLLVIIIFCIIFAHVQLLKSFLSVRNKDVEGYFRCLSIHKAS